MDKIKGRSSRDCISCLGKYIPSSFDVLPKKKMERLHFIFNITAFVSTLVIGNIAFVSIYQTIRDETVFMTNIHAIFLNPFFLITGSYLGLYII